MAEPILPFPRALYVCDYHVGYENGKADLYGLINAIRPTDGYPYTAARFCVFAQLVNGLGRIPFFIDVRDAGTDELIWTTQIKELVFPDRRTISQLAMTIEGCVFPRKGLYILDLYCDNTWVCDTQLQLL